MLARLFNYFSSSYYAISVSIFLLVFFRPIDALPLIGPIMTNVAFSLVLFTGMLRFLKQNFSRYILGILFIVTTALRFGRDTVAAEPFLVMTNLVLDALLVFYFLWLVLRELFRAEEADHDTIFGGVVSYLLMAIGFAVLFGILEYAEPGSFTLAGESIGEQESSFGALLYFSFVTITTLGFGDALPVSEYARSLTSLEAVGGQLLIGVIIARIVSLQTASQLKRND